jgi:hypothetical protein
MGSEGGHLIGVEMSLGERLVALATFQGAALRCAARQGPTLPGVFDVTLYNVVLNRVCPKCFGVTLWRIAAW